MHKTLHTTKTKHYQIYLTMRYEISEYNEGEIYIHDLDYIVAILNEKLDFYADTPKLFNNILNATKFYIELINTYD